MKINISGSRDGQDWPPIGECIVVPDAEGADLCGLGYAEPVAETPKPEKATPRKAAEKRG